MINLVAPMGQLGYGRVGLNVAVSLTRNYDVSLFPIGDVSAKELCEDDIALLKRAREKAQFFDQDAPCLRIWHPHDMSMFVGRGKKIGWPIFELDTFTELELHHLRTLDKVFVCSKWAKEVMVKNGFNPDVVSVVPLGVDTKVFSPVDLRHPSKTIFLNIGKWETRKGHDVIVKAFCRAFNETDKVELWMCCSNPFLTTEESNKWRSIYKNCELFTKVRIIDRLNTQDDVANLINKADCGVFPARAEGWNLEVMEMMACGKRVIVTNCTGHTEYCNESNSTLFDAGELEPAIGLEGTERRWFHGQGNWHSLDDSFVDMLSEEMKHVYKLKQLNGLCLNESGIETAKRFSWDNTAKIIMESL